MTCINIIKEAYDKTLPLFDGNLQIHDGYLSPYIEDSVELQVDLDDKTATLRDLGAFYHKFNTISEHGRFRTWRARIRFISRSELASLILRLRPALKEFFEQDEFIPEIEYEVQRIMEDYIEDSEEGEQKEVERQCCIIADRINFEDKLKPEWIVKNVQLTPSYYGKECYEYEDWKKAVEKTTNEYIDLLVHYEFDRIQKALREAEQVKQKSV